MYVTEKLQQDLSLTELCDLTHRGNVSIGWFGDLCISVDGFEGSEYIDVIAQKILDELKKFERSQYAPVRMSLKERVNGTLCLKKLGKIYKEEQLSLVHRIFLEFIEELRLIFTDDPYIFTTSIREEVRYKSIGECFFMQLPKSLFNQEFPDGYDNRPMTFIDNMLFWPLKVSDVLRIKGKAWTRSNIPRKAILEKLGPNFFNGD